MSSNENLQMNIMGVGEVTSQKSSNVQFIGDSPIQDPARKVSFQSTLSVAKVSIYLCIISY